MTAKDICNLTGVAPQTLDFWVRSKLITPSISPAKGTGSKREYSVSDAIQCSVAVMLRAMGVETRRIAPVLKRALDQQTAFIIIESSGEITSIPETPGMSTFQPNRTAMLLINVAAIRAQFHLPRRA